MKTAVVHTARVVAHVASGVVLLVGVCGFAGWVFDIPQMKGLFSGDITMKANAAFCLMMAGAALFLLLPEEGRPAWRGVAARVMAVLVATMGGLTLLEHLTGSTFGIDELVFREPPGAAATVSPNRMGPPASLSFLLSGLALLLLDVTTRRGRAPAQWLALLTGLIVMPALIGYAYSIQPLYGISKVTGIAMHTALAILALGIGLLAARPRVGLVRIVCANDVGGMTARRLLLPAVLLPFALGWLRTIGARYGWIDDAFGRPVLILSLIACLTTVVWWNAKSMSLLDRGRSRADEQRRESERVLRESEERLRLGMDAGNTGAWEWDIASGRVTWSQRVYEFHGLTPETFGGRVEDFQRLVHPDDAQRVGEAIRRAVEERAEYQIEFRVVHPSGEVRWLSTTGKVHFSPDGAPVRMMGATSDTTARKEAERARDELLASERAARAEAERANAAKDEFLATLSHELRTPLTPVLLTVSLMEMHPDLPADLRGDVATIRRNVELESRLISDLLDLTRISRGKMEFDVQEVDLHLIVRSAADICRRDASANVVLELAAARHTVRGDGTRLTQVFWNLINNAQKFTPADGLITIRSLNVEQDGASRLRVEVSDTGAGIDPQILPRLFNAFEQGDVRATLRHAGLGLGLAITRKLAEAHGGTVTAHSDGPGRGATFALELPLVEQLSLATAPRSVSAGPVISSASVEALNVLLVEDHEPTLEVLTKLLQSLGHRVTGATTVAAATAATSGPDGFDLLISDLGLPDGSGLDVLRQSRERYAGRAIALTGYGMESDFMASRAAGFAEHLIKPVDLATLQAAIGRVSRPQQPSPAA